MSYLRLLFVTVFVTFPFEAALGDSLQVDSKFPALPFRTESTSGPQLVALEDVQDKKAIVFIFASW